MVWTKQHLISNSEEGDQVLNNINDLVSTLSAPGLGKMHDQDGRVSYSEQAGRHLLCSTVETIMMGSMYQWVSLEMRTATEVSLGYLLLYFVSLSITIVLMLVLCIYSTMLCMLVCSVALPHHFMVGGLVSCKLQSVHAALSTFVLSNITFGTKLQVNRFLPSGNHQQPMNNEADTTKSKDEVWRLQQQ